jgi:hypothetical protein
MLRKIGGLSQRFKATTKLKSKKCNTPTSNRGHTTSRRLWGNREDKSEYSKVSTNDGGHAIPK